MSAPASTPSRHATCRQAVSTPNYSLIRKRPESALSGPLPGGAERQPGEEEGENQPADDPAVARRILVVDVAGEAVERLVLLLLNRRHQVLVASDGPAALKAWDAFRPEVVLLEIDLPGMDGLEVARRLQALQGSQDVLLVALTARAHEEDRRRCFEAGFDGHLPKPVKLDSLLQFLAHPKLLEKTTAQG
jgi:CheY-like chemotaxis protein